ncbi:DUF1385 domain-containing protein [bacterium]|nr:DUF1385 domain-containing protein [bacterium]MBU1650698.1 DUF1385 domain-containing protein [bacterium]
MSSPSEEKDRPKVGGQAIIEGVMMRSPQCVSAAVRLPDGTITQKTWSSQAWAKRNKFVGLPIIRGAVSLAEALVLGIKTLNWSADVAVEFEKGIEQKKSAWDSLLMVGAMLFAILLALVLFMWAPYQIATVLHTDQHQSLFHLVAGSLRILFFLIYIWLISLSKDIKRVFQYHGAEHQSIYTYEEEADLTVENARARSRFHPRCGTSFILIVALLTMLIFVIFDVVFVNIWGNYSNALMRLLVHLPFLPLVAGVSFEALRLSDRYSDSAFFRLLIAPGLALQRITTNPPDDSQIEVALTALKTALPENLEENPENVLAAESPVANG